MVAKQLALLALLLLAPMPAAHAGDPGPLPIPEMMEITGLDQVFAQFGANIATAPRMSGQMPGSDFARTWEATAAAMFDPEAMNRGLAEALGRHPLAVADQQAVRDFYESSLGRWIVTIETAVLKLPPDAALSAVEAGRRTSEVLSERRRAQYDRLWDATGDSATELARQVIWAIVLSASMSQRQGDVGPSWDAIDAAVEQMMPIALAEVKAQQLAQFAFVYQGLSDEDVEAYVSFLETPAARAYFTTSIAAMSEVIGEEMRRFGNALAARRPGAGA